MNVVLNAVALDPSAEMAVEGSLLEPTRCGNAIIYKPQGRKNDLGRENITSGNDVAVDVLHGIGGSFGEQSAGAPQEQRVPRGRAGRT